MWGLQLSGYRLGHPYHIPPGASDRQVQQQLVDLAEKYNLHQMQDLPTRENNILNLVFTTNPTLFKSTGNAPGLSDHDIVITNFCVRPFRTRQAPRKCHLFGKVNWEALRQAAAETSKKVTELSRAGKDVHDLWKTFKSQLSDAIDKHIPSALRSGKHQLPWMNGKLRRLTKKKRRLYRQARKTGSWANYRYTQKERKRLFRQAEWNFVNNTIQEGLAQNNSSKPFWEYSKSKRQDNIGTAPLKFNGTLCSDSKSKANILLQQFQSVFTKDNSLPPSSDESDPTYSPIPDLKIERQFPKQRFQTINISKAVGPDNIPNQVLKECATELAEGLTCIFQHSVDTGLLPADWRHANIIPVFKKGHRHLA